MDMKLLDSDDRDAIMVGTIRLVAMIALIVALAGAAGLGFRLFQIVSGI
jgi:hypothetical protein